MQADGDALKTRSVRNLLCEASHSLCLHPIPPGVAAMPRRPAPFEVLVIVLAFGHGVAAQLTSAVCQAGFDWVSASAKLSDSLTRAALMTRLRF